MVYFQLNTSMSECIKRAGPRLHCFTNSVKIMLCLCEYLFTVFTLFSLKEEGSTHCMLAQKVKGAILLSLLYLPPRLSLNASLTTLLPLTKRSAPVTLILSLILSVFL